MLDYIKTHLEQVAVIGAGLAALVAFLEKKARYLKRVFCFLVAKIGRAKRIEEAVLSLSKQVSEMHYQLHPNSGESMNDHLLKIAEEQKRMGHQVSFLMDVNEIRFRNMKFPAFHCDSTGRNLSVTAAYLILLGLTSEEALSNLNWAGYIHPDDLPEYRKGFASASSSESDFRRSARFQRSSSDQVGRWIVQADRLRDGTYLGQFIPDDELAEDLTKEHGWEKRLV